jgi:hypothetical protein
VPCCSRQREAGSNREAEPSAAAQPRTLRGPLRRHEDRRPTLPAPGREVPEEGAAHPLPRGEGLPQPEQGLAEGRSRTRGSPARRGARCHRTGGTCPGRGLAVSRAPSQFRPPRPVRYRPSGTPPNRGRTDHGRYAHPYRRRATPGRRGRPRGRHPQKHACRCRAHAPRRGPGGRNVPAALIRLPRATGLSAVLRDARSCRIEWTDDHPVLRALRTHQPRFARHVQHRHEWPSLSPTVSPGALPASTRHDGRADASPCVRFQEAVAPMPQREPGIRPGLEFASARARESWARAARPSLTRRVRRCVPSRMCAGTEPLGSQRRERGALVPDPSGARGVSIWMAPRRIRTWPLSKVDAAGARRGRGDRPECRGEPLRRPLSGLTA